MNTKSERVLRIFLTAWTRGEWETMHKNVQISWDAEYNGSPEKLQEIYNHRQIEDFEVIGVNKKLPAIVNYEFRIKIEGEWARGFCNVVCEKGPYKPNPRGRWGVNPASVLRYSVPAE